MKLLSRSMRKYARWIFLSIFIKLLATFAELMLPYILEHIIDDVVPTGRLGEVLLWGIAMFLSAILTRFLNVTANRRAVTNAHHVSYDIRQALFEKTMALSGAQFDAFGLPSLISRMTSDSYNVQSFAQQLQTLCVRAPVMLLGGIVVTLVMDRSLALILIVLLPFLTAVVLFVSAKGIPMFSTVQKKLDAIVRIMRVNFSGSRVVTALTKEESEKKRFAQANADM
ncbi:MAG: ABC transporter ATP-binding protein, partial [Lachnospiraceae bacterium]|nr:ABC transporter ATP-binding protein [Lachnospiraceae bacterium]